MLKEEESSEKEKSLAHACVPERSFSPGERKQKSFSLPNSFFSPTLIF
jgi:hypothetical protein